MKIFDENSAGKKAEIDYPCAWSYRIIGEDVQLLHAAAERILGNKEYSFTPSNTSSGGKYHAMEISLTVKSESERLEIFRQLKEDGAIKFVL